jgi:DNA-binding transcriptional ArsR family regulator
VSSSALDLVFQALADPTRRALVERLSLGPASVSELAQPLPISLPAVVQHLQVLEASGLIRSEKQGRVRTCRVEPAALRDLEHWASARRASWEQRFDRLGAFLAEQERADGDALPKAPRRDARARARRGRGS